MSFVDIELFKANLIASQSPWVPDEFENDVTSLIQLAKTYRKGDSFTAEKCSSLFTSLCRKHSSKLIFKKKVKSYLNRSKIYNIASCIQTPEETPKNAEQLTENYSSKFHEEASVPLPFNYLTGCDYFNRLSPNDLQDFNNGVVEFYPLENQEASLM